MEKYELAIIGGGVAGLSAAIQAEKLGIKAILFEATFLGGVA
ncbi:MAG: FAD-binding protein [Erysipelothrix sp.]|nr:FAD-binding protein [Erysipelothrix sp.]